MTPQEQKQKLLDALYKPYHACLQCPLGSLGRTQVVFGEGNPDARFMIIGEAPGADEDAQGRPFVGRSGKLLTATLETLGIQRKDIFITNVVKCRPPHNRPPEEFERTTCKNLLLLAQIKIIQPQVICTLGEVATQSLLGKVSISKIRGIEQTWQGVIVVPTYHPAYILRSRSSYPTFENDIRGAYLKIK